MDQNPGIDRSAGVEGGRMALGIQTTFRSNRQSILAAGRGEPDEKKRPCLFYQALQKSGVADAVPCRKLPFGIVGKNRVHRA